MCVHDIGSELALACQSAFAERQLLRRSMDGSRPYISDPLENRRVVIDLLSYPSAEVIVVCVTAVTFTELDL